jgi:hypothetical protein
MDERVGSGSEAVAEHRQAAFQSDELIQHVVARLFLSLSELENAEVFEVGITGKLRLDCAKWPFAPPPNSDVARSRR